LQGSPSLNPPPRVFAGSVPPDDEPPAAAPASKLSEEEVRKYEAAGAASGLPPTDEVFSSLRDPLKGVKLTTKKRRLKSVRRVSFFLCFLLATETNQGSQLFFRERRC
jgi:hypothetical protein